MGARAARRVSPLDWLMVAIAVGSVALLLLATFGDLPVRQQLLIFWVDVGVCVVFALASPVMGGASRCYGGSSSRMGGGVACSAGWWAW